MNRKLKSSLKLLASIVLFHSVSVTTADDTELFFTDTTSSIKPNLLFVMDVSGSMDNEVTISKEGEPIVKKKKLAIMQDALRTVLDSTKSTKNLNIGLMEYGELQKHYGSGQYPSGITFPITDIEALALPVVEGSLDKQSNGNVKWWQSKIPQPSSTVTVREYISDITDMYFKDSWYKKQYQGKSEAEIAMPRYGNTPIVDALYEAARYFRGEKLFFGQNDVSQDKARWSNVRAAVPSSYEGPPITWNGKLCKKADFTDRDDWYEKTFWDNSSYNNRWSNSFKNRRCAVILNDAKASEATKAACKVHESCTSRPKEAGTWCPTESYCPTGERRDGENNELYCPGGYKRRKTGTCYPYPADTIWTCKIPRCGGDMTSYPNYTSPIKNKCQSNFIVLMSDGKPQYSRHYDDNGNRDGTNTPGLVASWLSWGWGQADEDNRWSGIDLVDKSDANKKFDKDSCVEDAPSGYASGKCGPELTQFLATSDQANGQYLEGKQVINTFAIGFGLDPDEPKATEYLESLVTTEVDSDGHKIGYFSAKDELALTSAFDKIVRQIGATTDSLSSTGYSVNVKNGVSHENKIYVPVFKKSDQPTWSGNLKKFEITKVPDPLDSTKEAVLKIVDANGKVAMSERGVFQEDVQDLWSKTKDGATVGAGGVANLLLAADKRNLLTNSVSGSNALMPLLADNVSYQQLGLTGGDATSTYKGKIIRFIRGDRFDEDKKEYVQRFHLGDMMHSDPIVVTYDENYESSSEDNHGQVIYIGTNEGYLHAFDTVTGKEIFAFMPKRLLKNINKEYKNNALGHIYGVDGPMSVWNKMKADPNHPDKEIIDKVYLFFGLRRGGSAYYALDVTDPKSPKLKWVLDEKSTYGGSKVFAKLGQSWSKANHAKIRTSKSGVMRDVIVFSAGFDTNQDLYADDSLKLNPLKPGETDKKNGKRLKKKSTDSLGTDIFIVDAESGPTSYAWSMRAHAKGGTDLKHSVPGAPRIVDLDRDGAIDRMYFGDLDGNVWRLELPNGPDYDLEATDAAKLIKFASLPGSKTEHRKFFSEPDVARLTYKGKDYLTVSIGSGYRAHPLYEAVEDKFFVLIDKAVYNNLETDDSSKPDHFTTIVEAKLESLVATISNKTFNLSTGKLTKDKNILELKNKKGWALSLPSKGEKVLSTSVTRAGNLIFTTLAPNTDGENMGSNDDCGAPRAEGRAYVLDLLTGQPAVDLNGDDVISIPLDIMSPVSDNAIPNSPQTIFNEVKCDETTRECDQRVSTRIDKKASALFNVPLNYLESRYWSDPVIEEGK